MAIELRLALSDAAALSHEYEANLKYGRALVPEIVSAERTSPARLVLERRIDGASFALDATVAVVLEEGPMRGTVLELAALDERTRDALERFVHGEASSIDEELPTLGARAHPASEDAARNDAELEEDRSSVDPKVVRIRKLGIGERQRLARDGQLEERVLLERLFGKLVWEDLLRNPGLTPPEVARIAAKGTAPRHTLELIVDTQAWSRQSIVRRALLANPRIGPDAVQKLLRMTPKPELKLMTQGTAYPLAVRGLAKKLLDD